MTIDQHAVNPLANNLRKYRKEQGITQQELADSIGSCRQTIISIEKGDYTPSILIALKISKALNKNVEQIFTLN